MQASAITDLLRRAALPTLCLLIGLYFGFHALFGSSGVFALDGIRTERSEALVEQQRLKERKSELQQSITLLDPAGVDPDYADELVRRHLGVVRPDEIIIPLTNPDK